MQVSIEGGGISAPNTSIVHLDEKEFIEESPGTENSTMDADSEMTGSESKAIIQPEQEEEEISPSKR
jgi:hypothetical protein